MFVLVCVVFVVVCWLFPFLHVSVFICLCLFVLCCFCLLRVLVGLRVCLVFLLWFDARCLWFVC